LPHVARPEGRSKRERARHESNDDKAKFVDAMHCSRTVMVRLVGCSATARLAVSDGMGPASGHFFVALTLWPGASSRAPSGTRNRNRYLKSKLCKNCVRWARNLREILTFTESHHGASCGGNSLCLLRNDVFQCRSVSLARFAFQASSNRPPPEASIRIQVGREDPPIVHSPASDH
jgi:hypothetical protein